MPGPSFTKQGGAARLPETPPPVTVESIAREHLTANINRLQAFTSCFNDRNPVAWQSAENAILEMLHLVRMVQSIQASRSLESSMERAERVAQALEVGR